MTGAAAIRMVLRAALPLFGRVEVMGAENLGDGGRLLVANHVGWADPIWIAYAAYPRLLHQMAKKELFRSRWAARLLKALGAFPVDRARPSTATLRYAANLLRRGGWLLIFPMGTRDRTQTEARRGAALIAGIAQAPIVPVHYSGPADIRLTHLIRRPTIIIRFGPIIAVGADPVDRQGVAQLTSRLDGAIKALADRER
jgi:1-acyl-sn-glycerol-3-phosphate acyltransferase